MVHCSFATVWLRVIAYLHALREAWVALQKVDSRVRHFGTVVTFLVVKPAECARLWGVLEGVSTLSWLVRQCAIFKEIGLSGRRVSSA